LGLTQNDFRDEKDLIAAQSKVSVDTAKDVANDKTLKTKNDKDRRLKEKQQTNTKKFMEERKTAKIRAAKEKEKLEKKHQTTEKTVTSEIASVSTLDGRFSFLARTASHVCRIFRSSRATRPKRKRSPLAPRITAMFRASGRWRRSSFSES
jgi:hypothetical protein